jgi:glycosyltransferase involved in cell wall biosynthesis
MAAPCAWELLLVDNGSTDSTRQVITAFSTRAPFPVHYILETRPGLGRARNAGWQRSSGSIVAFTDDDCYPRSDFLEHVFSAFANQNIDYLGGRVLLHDPNDYPITIQTHPDRIVLPAEKGVIAGLIHGANMCARRNVLENCEGFDPLLGPGAAIPAGDDHDFLDRASASGFIGVYDPDVVIYHHHGRRLPQDVARLQRAYDVSRGACYMKGILDRRRRGYLTREWYWSLRSRMLVRVSRIPWREITRELRGAARYLLLRATTSPQANKPA